MKQAGSHIFVFSMFLPKFRKAMRRENKIGKKQPESYRVIFGILIGTIVPVLMSTTIYNMVSIVDQWLFKNIATIQGYSATDVSEWWGIFSGKYRVLTNVPISISTALAASCVPALAAAFAQKDEEQVRSKIGMSMRFIMVVACRVLQVSWYWQIRSSSFCFRVQARWQDICCRQVESVLFFIPFLPCPMRYYRELTGCGFRSEMLPWHWCFMRVS